VTFVDVLTRQAHPGPSVEPYASDDDKRRDARRHVEENGIPWTVAIDDLAGTAHQTYGGLTDPTFLIDAEGRVAYYSMWTHAPTLWRAAQALEAQGGRGVVLGGVDHAPHLLAMVTYGWPAIQRGLPQSAIDLEMALPLSSALIWAGNQLRPLLAPVAGRGGRCRRSRRWGWRSAWGWCSP
jgi:hypothetical protein